MTLVLGIDIGGTATRAVVTTLGGTRAGSGRAGAANPVTVPAAEAAANLTAALTAALSTVDVARIGAAVAGAAGGSRPAVLQAAFDTLGVRCPLRVVGDAVIAFAAGTTEPAGSVLISGTGAVAAEIRAGTIACTADGLGWLLGDLGSGFWIGRSAATAVARALYRGDPPGPLARLVTAAVGAREGDPFVAAVHDRPPRELAALTPLVTAAAADGDPVALSIMAGAATHLCQTLAEIREPGDRRPIVLAGGVLRHCLPLRAAVRARLTAAWPAAPVLVAGPGEEGAARLAAHDLTAYT
ncbi:BadF/BadG/BcrA/BcrD ATPase family protein [Phytohabitans sp. ZYX-F-186]|uniref:BadF/BadG/BcrA/BcrD ATPase family protein n=1 Tax=Phytohabitans maris TaxID=3071409 RepID=A0ABU0ZJR7_9ACTN|nr:BadF/BadG/BcrA/BcrD ATPase family protein [Phytohabitans sp. ZYX-F-186]MDQ7907223.1 BadF/BadG/BcrA/BcrD ATPase family protein [Phytohabitans sp. ZYX-F-186]